MAELEIGDKVMKVGGRYGGPGTIVGKTVPLYDSDYVLYSVAMEVRDGYGQFVHVFPATVLRKVDAPERSASLRDAYFIWNTVRRAWWRPHRRGYTEAIQEAGTYSRREALEIVRDSMVGTSGLPGDLMVRVLDATMQM